MNHFMSDKIKVPCPDYKLWMEAMGSTLDKLLNERS
jgi:hypothetical protein